MGEIEGRNMRIRALATRRREDTYRHEVVTDWPACTACGTPIRRNVEIGKPGLWRACDCPGVVWRSDTNGWTKLAAPALGLDHPAGRGEGET